LIDRVIVCSKIIVVRFGSKERILVRTMHSLTAIISEVNFLKEKTKPTSSITKLKERQA